MGLRFLRHVERTRVLLHVVDVSATSGRDPVDDLRLAREEVRQRAPSLLERPQLVVASKRDLAPAEGDPLPAFRDAAAREGLEVVEVSAVTGFGLDELKRRLLRMLESAPAALEAHP